MPFSDVTFIDVLYPYMRVSITVMSRHAYFQIENNLFLLCFCSKNWWRSGLRQLACRIELLNWKWTRCVKSSRSQLSMYRLLTALESNEARVSNIQPAGRILSAKQFRVNRKIIVFHRIFPTKVEIYSKSYFHVNINPLRRQMSNMLIGHIITIRRQSWVLTQVSIGYTSTTSNSDKVKRMHSYI